MLALVVGFAELCVTRLVQIVTLDDYFYLGPRATWRTLQTQTEGRLMPLPRYLLYYLPPITLAILVARFIYERYIALPLGRHLNVSERRPSSPEPNAVLERSYRKNSKPDQKLIAGLAKSIDKPVRYVERWQRRQRNVSLPSQMTKFQEGSWRFLAYLVLLVFGFYVVPNKPYWHNTRLCWENYPNFSMPTDVFWYLMVELSFYISLTISQFMDIRRKDFWQMFIHHAVTIFLIFYSYITHYFAIGSMIMFVHDMADPWLEIAKVIGYTRPTASGGRRSKRQLVGEACFIIFMLVFFYTRLYLYPTHCIRSVTFELKEMLGPEAWPMWSFLIALLLTLYALHLFWSYQIIRVVRESIIAGKVKGDVRSADEDSSEETQTTSSRKNGHGHTPTVATKSKASASATSNGTNGGSHRGGQRR